eukprot:TRINITY_DN9399_c0_g1_i2.p3 TRINITY_DN9399_c0_g1~~TRINITY_DN9399_c0_g1_i2.p3  ORF type:complete len:104 (-),score=12.90 TRINITY_DN9399_c0_g1_i2:4715-5026(-)
MARCGSYQRWRSLAKVETSSVAFDDRPMHGTVSAFLFSLFFGLSLFSAFCAFYSYPASLFFLGWGSGLEADDNRVGLGVMVRWVSAGMDQVLGTVVCGWFWLD